MESELVNARIYTDLKGLADLRLAAKKESSEALTEVASQFEGIFIQMMLKSMREASLGEGIFESDQSSMYLELFDQQISLQLAGQNNFGIANMMMQQLGDEHKNNTLTPAKGMLIKEDNAIKPADNEKLFEINEKEPMKFSSPEEFINYLKPYAEEAAEKLNISSELLLAQAALETGWGKKIIKQKGGDNTHNLFGIKADERWDGKAAIVSTLEFEQGLPEKRQAAFRAYDSYEQSFKDYVEFIQSNSRYQPALMQGVDSKGYIQQLQLAGYATDPHYAEKVIDIMDRVRT